MITPAPPPPNLSLLLVDDEPLVLEGLRRQFRQARPRWEVVTAIGGRAALERLDGQHFDVVVSDMRMPDLVGSEVLGRAAQRQPGAIRFILSGYSEREDLLRCLGPAHRWLSKPCDLAVLQTLIGRSIELRRELAALPVQRIVATVTPAAVLPEGLRRLVADLSAADPGRDLQACGLCVDPALAARIAAFSERLMSVASGGAHLTASPGTMRAIALAAHLSSTLGRDDPAIWQHGVQVGRTARAIAAGLPGHEVEMAVTAGLLHDCGRLVFAEQGHDAAEALDAARRAGMTLEQAERSVFGCDHGLVGAALLARWDLPDGLVEAVAWHHRPTPGNLDGALAVHIADALSGAREAAELDCGLLSTAGVGHRLEEWRRTAGAEHSS